jgi:hypothetical protein
MTVNAAEQPQVRAGSLPTSTPRTIQRPAAPETAAAADAAAAAAADGAAPAEGAADKPRRKYNRRAKPKLNTSAGLSREELAAWGEIAIEARNAGVSVERYMTDLENRYGVKLSVWGKLKAPVQSVEGEDAEPVVQA